MNKNTARDWTKVFIAMVAATAVVVIGGWLVSVYLPPHPKPLYDRTLLDLSIVIQDDRGNWRIWPPELERRCK